MFKMIIGSDIIKKENNIELFKAGNAEKIVGEDIWRILKETDFTVFNLILFHEFTVSHLSSLYMTRTYKYKKPTTSHISKLIVSHFFFGYSIFSKDFHNSIILLIIISQPKHS